MLNISRNIGVIWCKAYMGEMHQWSEPPFAASAIITTKERLRSWAPGWELNANRMKSRGKLLKLAHSECSYLFAEARVCTYVQRVETRMGRKCRMAQSGAVLAMFNTDRGQPEQLVQVQKQIFPLRHGPGGAMLSQALTTQLLDCGAVQQSGLLGERPERPGKKVDPQVVACS